MKSVHEGGARLKLVKGKISDAGSSLIMSTSVHPGRRPRRSVDHVDSSSSQVDYSCTPVEPELASISLAGTRAEWTSDGAESAKVESSLIGQKPCLSAAARRCRRVNESRRAR